MASLLFRNDVVLEASIRGARLGIQAEQHLLLHCPRHTVLPRFQPDESAISIRRHIKDFRQHIARANLAVTQPVTDWQALPERA